MATAFEAESVMISTGSGFGNDTPPPNDPGFYNVGKVNGKTGVYVRNGWVLTANHVGEHQILLQVVLEGVLQLVAYDPVPGSRVQIQSPADLIAFKILGPKPPLPDLAITNSAPTVNTSVTIVGNGINRGTATTWDLGTPNPSDDLAGWNWGNNKIIRWGTNQIDDLDADTTFGLDPKTEAFSIVFDDGNPEGLHEAMGIPGDSGGAAFTGSGGTAELIGIMLAHISYTTQPEKTSLYTNGTIIADLFAYRNQILAIIDQPSCSDGLDDDGDGLTDYPNDPGCTDASDSSERGAVFECDNGIDDDDDGFLDFPNDPDCLGPTDETEAAPVPLPTGLLGASVLTLCMLALTARAALIPDLVRAQASSTRSTR
jgi:hypothetical protein